MVNNLKNISAKLAFSDTGRPLVSVIMPVYNAQATLGRAVQSVLDQSHPSWELILIDDGSRDCSPQLCQEWVQRDPRIRLVTHAHNQGAARARNSGLAQAGGRYVAFLDADDEWLFDKLARQTAFMKMHNAVLCYGDFIRSHQGQGHRVKVPAQVDRAQLLRGNVIGCLTAMFDRDYFGDVRMPVLPRSEDFAFWLELLTRAPMAHGINEVLAIYHVTPGSLSASRLKALCATWAVYRQSLPRWQAAFYITQHLVRRLRRG